VALEVMVVNPRAMKDFGRASMQRAKTDAVDAGVIVGPSPAITERDSLLKAQVAPKGFKDIVQRVTQSVGLQQIEL
jgi:transposase